MDMNYSGVTLLTNEGIAAWTEAITFLNSQTALSPISVHNTLTNVAIQHSSYLVSLGTLSHTGNGGTNLRQRVDNELGYNSTGYLSENLAWLPTIYSSDYAKYAVMAWIVDDGVSSRGHRTNLFDPNMNYMGAGFVQDPSNGYYYVTQDFSSENFNNAGDSGSNYDAPTEEEDQEDPAPEAAYEVSRFTSIQKYWSGVALIKKTTVTINYSDGSQEVQVTEEEIPIVDTQTTEQSPGTFNGNNYSKVVTTVDTYADGSTKTYYMLYY